MIFIRRRGLQNLNRERPAFLPYHQYIEGVQYFIYSHSFHLAVQRREALWCLIDVGLWQRILRCVVHLASGCSILPVDSDRVCHTLQVLWYSLSFGSCSRSSGIPFRSRGYCVCTWIVELVVIHFVVQLREALWCLSDVGFLAEDSERCIFMHDLSTSKVRCGV